MSINESKFILEKNGYRVLKIIRSIKFYSIMKVEKDSNYFIAKCYNVNNSLAKKLFLNEMRILRVANCMQGIDGIPKIIDNIGGRILILILNFIEGKTLDRIIEEKQTEKIVTKIKCMGKLAEILEKLHSKGICHNDLGLENIIYRENKNLKVYLIDFNFSFIKDDKRSFIEILKEINEENSCKKYTLGRITDTRRNIFSYYPIQNNNEFYCPDIYSFGIIFLQLLLRNKDRDTMELEVRNALRRERDSKLSKYLLKYYKRMIPRDIAKLIEKCIEGKAKSFKEINSMLP